MINTPLFFYLSLAALAVATFLHVRSSQNFLYYGDTENNPLWRDKYGYFTTTKYLLSLGIVTAFLIFAAFQWWGYQTGITFYIFAAGFFVMTWINNSSAKKNRVLQTKVLMELRGLALQGITDPNAPEILAVMRGHSIRIRHGRAFYKLFGWLRATVPEGTPNNSEEAATQARQLVVAHAQRPDSEWFK